MTCWTRWSTCTSTRCFEQSIPRWQGNAAWCASDRRRPPKELASMDLRIELTSILAQAQKAIGVSSIERAIGFSGTVATATPEPCRGPGPARRRRSHARITRTDGHAADHGARRGRWLQRSASSAPSSSKPRRCSRSWAPPFKALRCRARPTPAAITR